MGKSITSSRTSLIRKLPFSVKIIIYSTYLSHCDSVDGKRYIITTKQNAKHENREIFATRMIIQTTIPQNR